MQPMTLGTYVAYLKYWSKVLTLICICTATHTPIPGRSPHTAWGPNSYPCPPESGSGEKLQKSSREISQPRAAADSVKHRPLHTLSLALIKVSAVQWSLRPSFIPFFSPASSFSYTYTLTSNFNILYSFFFPFRWFLLTTFFTHPKSRDVTFN